MKSLLTRASLLAALVPLCVLVPAAAQSLGMAAADPWIGRPLEITVPARFVSSDSRDECVQADVFDGDQRLPRAQVRTSVTGPAGDRVVRIATDAPVSEPIVTVALRAGCTSTVTRTYTLLPAMPTGTALAAAAARLSGAGAVAEPMASGLRLAAVAQSAQRPAAVTRPAAERPRSARMDRVERSREVSGPRLRLDAWDPAPQTMLRVSAQLTEPTQDAARRATAALLWQAINADPSELMRTSATLQRLETELAQLRAAANQTRADMAALRQALDAPPSGFGLSGALAQTLIALVLSAAAVAAFLWWRTARQQHAGDWLGRPLDSKLDSASPASVGPQPAGRRESGPGAPQVPGVLVSEIIATGPVDLAEDGPELDPLELDLAGQPVAGPQLRTETLAATFQEVEFLTSLGLWGDAMDVLKAYLADSSAPAPIAYFELLRLYAYKEDAAGAAAARERYAQVFGTEPPPQAQIEAPQGLQAGSELATRITRSWGTPQALDLIEEQLFAVPAPDSALSLEAGRDLLCLYQVAGELQRQDAQARGEVSEEHGLAPWAHSGEGSLAPQAVADFNSDDSLGLDLDLDLGAPSHALEAQAAIARELLAQEQPLELQLLPIAPDSNQDSDPFSEAMAHEGHRPIPR